MNKWFTYIIQPPTTDPTFRGKEVAMLIGENMGYRRLSIFRYDGSTESNEALNSRIDGITAAVSMDDIVVYQYPSYNGGRFDRLFITKMKNRNCKVILYIRDSDIIRGGASQQAIADETDIFNRSDVIITLSEAFNDKLKSLGFSTRLIAKEFWDYYVNEEDLNLGNSLSKKIVFAGNLSKSQFLSQWDFRAEITAFGNKDNMVLSPKVHYGGRFFPQELVRHMSRDVFGLSWDDNIAGGGDYQSYTKYNCPNKVSLYLALGLPVLVWEQSAIAKVVRKHQVGYTISSLEEIDCLFATLTEDDLLALKLRTNRLSVAIRDGFFTRQALIEAEKFIFDLSEI